MEPTSKGIIKADIIAARQAIEYFEEHKTKDIKNIAGYHLQQASEKIIKNQIYEQLDDESIDFNKMFVHDLDKLIAYANSENIKLNIPKYIVSNRNEISKWEAGSRYELGISVRIDTLKKTYNVISEWYDEIM